ncbi:MAG: DUF4340 domain-containing protein [Deltaproteobacteria bacterium]|nr:DUF4340 domain-containing protein [Deltaproteobacteria bacterium]
MKKSTLVAVIVFVALALGVVFTLTTKPERGISRLSMSGVVKDKVDRVEVTGKNPVTLVKADGVWKIENGKAADAGAVDRMLDALAKVQSSDLVTRAADRYAELEVDDEKGARVKAYAGKDKVAELVIGKAASGGAYVRADDAVYTASGVNQATFSHDKASWLERKLFDDKIADVKRVEVALAAAKPYALIAEGDAWKLDDPAVLPKDFRFDANAARSLVSSLVNLRAKDILDADPGVEKTGLADKADVLAYVIEQGTGDTKTTVRRELKLGAALEDKSVYAMVSGKTDVVTLPEYTVKNLKKAVTDFRDLKLMDFDKDKVTKLTIVDGKMKLAFVKVGADWKIDSSTEAVPKDFELDPMAVTRRLAALQSARAAKVVDVPPATSGLAAPVAEVTAGLEGKKTVSIAFGKSIKDEDRDVVFARGNADKAVYLVTKWTRENLAGGLKTFKKTAADPSGLSGLDPKALQGLPPDVRAGLQKQIEDKKRQQEMIERLSKQANAQKK